MLGKRGMFLPSFGSKYSHNNLLLSLDSCKQNRDYQKLNANDFHHKTFASIIIHFYSLKKYL